MVDSRKIFKLLTDKLKKLKIRFRWEIPMGLHFFYKGKRKLVTDKEEMWEITKELEKDLKSLKEGEGEGEIRT